MTETAIRVTQVIPLSVHGFDASDIASADNYKDLYEILRAAAKAKKLWCALGAPTYSSVMRTGDFVIDKTTPDVYVVNAGACVKLADS